MITTLQCGQCGVVLETEAQPGERVACANCGANVDVPKKIIRVPKPVVVPTEDELGIPLARPFTPPLLASFLRAIGHIVWGLYIVGGIWGAIWFWYRPEQGPAWVCPLLVVGGIALGGFAAFFFFAFAQIFEAVCRTAHEAQRANVLLEHIARKP